MTELRIINAIVWGAVMLYMAPAAWNAAFGKQVRRGDPMRLGCFTTALVMVGFNLRWLFASDSVAVWQTLYVLAALDALFILRLGSAYGRGPHV